MKRSIWVFITLLLLSSAAADEKIRIIDYTFIPVEVTIQQGASVTWVNEAKTTHHRIKFTLAGEMSTLIGPGENFTRTFDEPGNFPFQSAALPAQMRGTVKVVEFRPLEPKIYRPGNVSCVNCTMICAGDNCTMIETLSCGDGVCASGENASTCCADCPCGKGQECRAMACVTPPPKQSSKKTAIIIGVLAILFAFFFRWQQKIRRGY